MSSLTNVFKHPSGQTEALKRGFVDMYLKYDYVSLKCVGGRWKIWTLDFLTIFQNLGFFKEEKTHCLCLCSTYLCLNDWRSDRKTFFWKMHVPTILFAVTVLGFNWLVIWVQKLAESFLVYWKNLPTLGTKSLTVSFLLCIFRLH